MRLRPLGWFSYFSRFLKGDIVLSRGLVEYFHKEKWYCYIKGWNLTNVWVIVWHDFKTNSSVILKNSAQKHKNIYIVS